MIKSYRLILFDFDGTLVDTAPDIAFHANQVLQEFGAGVHSLERVKKAVGRGVHELLRDLGICENEGQLERAVLSFKKRYWETPIIHTQPYPGVYESLAGPLRDLPKAIVTNKPYELTLKILKALSMDGYFKEVIGLDLEFPAKPDPASVNFVMDRYGAKAQETLFIGDSTVDAETCQNSGADFGWVNYGYDQLNGHRPVIEFSSAYEWRRLV